MFSDSTAVTDAMRRHLSALKALRGRGASGQVAALKRWQSQRLMRTYADLSADPRYAKATRYFVDDLYGPKDFSSRDAALLKIVPMMVRILPAKAVEAAALSIEVEALSEDLDHRLAAALGEAAIDEESYATAYRASAKPEERERQVRLVIDVGHRLDSLVRWPFVLRTLRLMRTPARLAGLSDLQDFLERGFHAFASMGGADDFLRIVEERETALLKRLFSGEPSPFSPSGRPASL
jgi:hypothetical protein